MNPEAKMRASKQIVRAKNAIEKNLMKGIIT
jgi:hypothetical protein